MKRFDMVMPVELIARVDSVRGDASRALWVRRAVESALGEGDPPKVVRGASDVPSPPAPSRPPVSKSAVAACPECGAVGRMHQRGCSKSK